MLIFIPGNLPMQLMMVKKIVVAANFTRFFRMILNIAVPNVSTNTA
ncbi:hypothetical protein [Priestia taiwanensis]|nr:hypothetical protein [Priestia taiwanensis]MBM7362059.1 hypothetical protein [Priestia taiwanensis]